MLSFTFLHTVEVGRCWVLSWMWCGGKCTVAKAPRAHSLKPFDHKTSYKRKKKETFFWKPDERWVASLWWTWLLALLLLSRCIRQSEPKQRSQPPFTPPEAPAPPRRASKRSGIELFSFFYSILQNSKAQYFTSRCFYLEGLFPIPKAL